MRTVTDQSSGGVCLHLGIHMQVCFEWIFYNPGDHHVGTGSRCILNASQLAQVLRRSYYVSSFLFYWQVTTQDQLDT